MDPCLDNRNALRYAPRVKRKCPICGTRFYPTVPWQEFCKPACRAKAFRRRKKEVRRGRLHPPSR